MSWRTVAIGLGCALLALVYVSSMMRRQRPTVITSAHADISSVHADMETTLKALQAQSDQVRTLVDQSEQASLQLRAQLKQIKRDTASMAAVLPKGAAASPGFAGIPSVAASAAGIEKKSCPAGCERFGNCNELSGECSCPITSPRSMLHWLFCRRSG